MSFATIVAMHYFNISPNPNTQHVPKEYRHMHTHIHKHKTHTYVTDPHKYTTYAR